MFLDGTARAQSGNFEIAGRWKCVRWFVLGGGGGVGGGFVWGFLGVLWGLVVLWMLMGGVEEGGRERVRRGEGWEEGGGRRG